MQWLPRQLRRRRSLHTPKALAWRCAYKSSPTAPPPSAYHCNSGLAKSDTCEQTRGLWVHEVRATGRLTYLKLLGSQNPVDILTKNVPVDLLPRHLETLKTVRGGRAETAPGLSASSGLISSGTSFQQRRLQSRASPLREARRR